jgi:GNAT superfamily N-acetyltransferase
MLTMDALPLEYEHRHIRPECAHSMALLTHTYERIYMPAFPIEDERESLETFTGALTEPGDVVRYIIIVIGRNLDQGTDAEPACIGIANYYPGYEVGLLAYVATAPEARNRGLAKTMLRLLALELDATAERMGGTLRGIFGETNDPAKVAAQTDSFDPQTRIDMYQRWGHRIAPIDYVQPALEPGMERCDKLKLLMIPHPVTGAYPGAEEMARFVEGIYTELGVDIERDRDFHAIRKQITASSGWAEKV